MMDRRLLLKGLTTLVCAPVIARVASLAPVSARVVGTAATPAINMGGVDLIVGVVYCGDPAGGATDNLGNIYTLASRSKRGSTWQVHVPSRLASMVRA